MHSGKHGHMEAPAVCPAGRGLFGHRWGEDPVEERVSLSGPGPQTVHQHFNTGQVESQLLRVHFGIRSAFFQAMARRTFPYKFFEYSSYGNKD